MVAALDLTFEVENEKETYLPGDEIKGMLYVTTEKKAKCKGLTLALTWETHGKGDVHEEDVEVLELFEGEFPAHAEKGFPFSFVLPAGPFSYSGEYLNVEWGLYATCDVPWAKDPKAFYPILLEPGDDMEPTEEHDKFLEEYTVPLLGGTGMLKMIVMFCMGFSLVGAISIITGIGAKSEFRIFLGVAFLFMGVFVGRAPIRRFLAERRLRELQCKMVPAAFSPGDPFACHLQFTPSKDTKVLKAKATLSCYEQVSSGGGSSKEVHTFELYSKLLELPQEELGTFRGGEVATFVFEGKLPDDAPLTFTAPDNDLVWALKIHMDIHRCPDWVEEIRMLVMPKSLKDKLVD